MRYPALIGACYESKRYDDWKMGFGILDFFFGGAFSGCLASEASRGVYMYHSGGCFASKKFPVAFPPVAPLSLYEGSAMLFSATKRASPVLHCPY
jgi:hypothetical protein